MFMLTSLTNNLGLFLASSSKSPATIDYIVLAMTVVGVICILLSFVPQFLAVVRTRNTVAFNKIMFTLHSLVATCFLIAAIIILATEPDHTVKIVRFSLMVFINVVLAMLCVIMIMVKIFNEQKSKQLGISELEYYNKYIKTQTTQS